MPPVLEIEARLRQEGEIQSGVVTGERVRGRRGQVVLGAPGVRAAGTLVFGGLRPGAGTQIEAQPQEVPCGASAPLPSPAGAPPDSQALGRHLLEEAESTPPLVWGLHSSVKRQGPC